MKKGLLNKTNYAPLWKRIVAFIIDWIVIGFIILLPLGSAGKSKLSSLSETLQVTPTKLTSEMIIVSIIIAIIMILYWTILEYKIHQSVGKILMRLQVVSKTKSLTLWQCLVRNLTKFSSPLLFLDVIYMLITRSHQRFLEKTSNTEVIELSKHDTR
ncbi:MAG: RDD family protein [Nanoarchaeota archaeon]